MTTYYTREGECNRCGQCCGAPGGPDQRSPFPHNWPEAYNGWQYQQMIDECSVLVLVGAIAKPDGTNEYPNRHGTTRVAGGGPPRNFPWVWVPGAGCCKDISPDNDGTVYEPMCPFLQDDPGDGTRPCGLVGTGEESRFIQWCQVDPEYPRSEASMNEWQWRHPDCSYTWVEQV